MTSAAKKQRAPRERRDPITFSWKGSLDGYQLLPAEGNPDDKVVAPVSPREEEPIEAPFLVPRELLRRTPGRPALQRRDPRDCFLEFSNLTPETAVGFASLWGALGVEPTIGLRPHGSARTAAYLGAKVPTERIAGESLAAWMDEVGALKQAVTLWLDGKREETWDVINAKFRTTPALRATVRFDASGKPTFHGDTLLSWLWYMFADRCARNWREQRCLHCGVPFVEVPAGERPPRVFCSVRHKGLYFKAQNKKSRKRRAKKEN